jgi:uncharacterized protein (DUF433 family)
MQTNINLTLYGGLDPREVPAYGISEAASYLKIPLATLRSWIRGRGYTTRAGRRKFQPIITLPDQKLPLLSFMNLVEAHILDAIRYRNKVPLPNVRHAIKYLSKSGYKHPLADLLLRTNGLDLFIDQSGLLINVSRDGQIEMKEIIEAYLQRVERDASGIAARLFPFIRRHPIEVEREPKLVLIDPLISFGRPVLVASGIPTGIIAERFYAGDSVDELAKDYDRPKAEIEEAIRYQEFPEKRAA